MQFKVPKNTEKYEWTRHAVYKMKQYGLTAQRVLRVVKNPQRTETGIVKNTIAVMQPASTRTLRSPTRGGPASTRMKNGKKTWSREIWAMYQLRPRGAKPKAQNPKPKINLNQKIRIISAWRYPGVSPKRDPIPADILRELEF